jgi:hypothetical protein
MLRRGLKNGIDVGLLGLYVALLMVAMLLLSQNGCAMFSKSAGIERIPTDPIIQTIDNREYWCLEKQAFTAVLQEASRECD